MRNERPALTDRMVSAAKPPARTDDGKAVAYLRDGKTRGFGLRITESGQRAFYFECKFHGRTRRVILGPYPALTVQAARNLAHEKRGDLARGIDPTTDKRTAGAFTVGDLISGWRTGSLFDGRLSGVPLAERKRSARDDEQRLRDFVEPLARRQLSDLTGEEIGTLHTRIAKQRGPYAANRTLALLRAMFRLGQRKKMLPPGPLPTDGVEPCDEIPRDRALNRKEARAILASIAVEENPYWRAYFVLLLMLGRRRSELLSARWTDIDLESDEPTWRLPYTKSGRPELIELPPPAVEILEALPRESEFVFPGTGKHGHLCEPKGAWGRVLERAKINDVRLHDLRRTVGTWLRKSGVDLMSVSHALGHRQVSTTSRHYAALDRDDRRQALGRMATLLLEALPDENDADASA